MVRRGTVLGTKMTGKRTHRIHEKGVFPVVSRRAFVRGGTLATLCAFWETVAVAADFWKSRPPALWTPDEIGEIATKSPWAKQTIAQYRAAMDDVRIQPGAPPVERSRDGTVGECGLVPCSNIMPGKVVVIWESAKPIREALRIPPDRDLVDRYALSVRGLAGDYVPNMLKAGTNLAAKGRSPLQPGVVFQRHHTWVFGFSKEMLPLEVSDKEVTFTIRIGANLSNTLLRATFNLKEMIYQDELAL